MKFDEKIAEITIEPKTKQIVNVNFLGNPVRFRCQRCAIFCCKLGGPKLTSMDVKRLMQSEYDPHEFLDDNHFLKNKKGGSCVFLSFSAIEHLHLCSIYGLRLTLCRLYPFQFEKSGPQSYVLKVIPCCNGLNSNDDETVDAKFFSKNLQQVFLDLIESGTL